jgi:quinol monooxygenase YgiN
MKEVIMVIITASIKAKEGQGDEMEKAIKKLAPKFCSDPGCKMYTVHRNLENPDQFFFYEQYDDEAAVTYHMASSTFKEMGVAMGPHIGGKPEVYRYKIVC